MPANTKEEAGSSLPWSADLTPDSSPVDVARSGLLNVGDGQRIYWEEFGNPHGLPALFLHGGPGAGLMDGAYRGAFDASRYRIIGIDQRGCGRSTPLVTAPGYDLASNTTEHLIADIEKVRRHLGVERWHVAGVSWGVTLAVAYAQTLPERVLAMTLVAVTTTDRFYVDWITDTVSAIYPEAWDQLAAHAEGADAAYQRGRDRVIEAYARLMRHPDPTVRDEAAQQWIEWEYHHVSIGTDGISRVQAWDDDPETRQVLATLVAHYWSNNGFLDPPITDARRMARVASIPATLIHGRRDVSGPPVLAFQLHKSWPAADLIIVENEGHGGPAMAAAWREATDRYADVLTMPTSGGRD